MYNAKRILIIGSGGSGKTTFSNILSKELGLPVYYLDSLYWGPNWSKPILSDWIRTVEELTGREEWIIDGSYFVTLDIRVPRADLIIFLDISRWVCLKNILLRRIKYARFTGKKRPGRPLGCEERIHGSFLKRIWTYPQKEKPKILAKVEALKLAHTPLLICKNYRELYTLMTAIAHKSCIPVPQAN